MSSDYGKLWADICKVYDDTKDSSPDVTVNRILDDMSLDEAITVFAAVSKIKKHDGRIYGENRKFMDGIVIPDGLGEYSHSNPIFNTGLTDHIHTSHINQMISVLRNKCA